MNKNKESSILDVLLTSKRLIVAQTIKKKTTG